MFRCVLFRLHVKDPYMAQTVVKIGPRSHGKRMSLDDFERAECQEGFVYELGRGVINVMDVPGVWHGRRVDETRRQFDVYRNAHPGRIYLLAGGSDCKILVAALKSERHPDLAVYLYPPAEPDDPWATWIPDIVIEIVSPGSEERDYQQKPEEYLLFGVREYWIIDPEKEEMLVHRRVAGRWKKTAIKPPAVHRTRILPGLEFSVAKVFAAGAGV
jgi:Uma2 family endonuclease